MMIRIKETLEGADNISITADVYTIYHRNYLGIIIYWMDKKSLKRWKSTIACNRIIGHHTQCPGSKDGISAQTF